MLPLSLGVSAIAVLVVAGAYAGGRSGAGWADPVFWTGQLLLFVATAAVVLGRRRSWPTVVAGVLTFNVAQYLIKVMYSPLQVKFADELQHERSAEEILQTGRLFPRNFSLPISTSYPGLEAVAVGLRDVTGLSLHVSELLTAGVAHVLLGAAVLVLLRALTPDSRLAGAAALFYCLGSYHAIFGSLFVYQTLALPLAALVMAQVVQLRRPGGRWARLALIAFLGAAVVVTHHVTSTVLAVALIGYAVATVVHRPSRPAARWIGAAALLDSALLVVWTALAARDTLTYLGEPLTELFGSVGLADSGRAAPGSSQPLLERAFTYGSVGLPLAALLVVTWLAVRRRRYTAATTAGIAVLVQVAVIVVRLVASNGTEMAGRAYAFTSLFCAAALAVAGAAVRSTAAGERGGPRMSARIRAAAPVGAVAVFTVIFVGGVTSGWPPAYERLPGRHQVAGYESAMDAHTVQASSWVERNYPPGTRFAADFGNLSAVGTIGNQFPVIGDYAELFRRTEYDPRDGATVRLYELQVLIVDSRLAQQPPPPDSGVYFQDETPTAASAAPLSGAALDKFRTIPGVACVFDDGTIRIYDLRGSRYADAGQ